MASENNLGGGGRSSDILDVLKEREVIL